jgi:hypothetical protein
MRASDIEWLTGGRVEDDPPHIGITGDPPRYHIRDVADPLQMCELRAESCGQVGTALPATRKVLWVEKVLWAEQDGDLGTDATDGRQPTLPQGAASEIDQSIGAALGRCAKLISAWRGHQRVEGGGKRRATLRVELALDEDHAIVGRQGDTAPVEVLARIGLGAVRIRVRDDPLTRLSQLGGVALAGDRGQDRLGNGHRIDADPVGQPDHPVEVLRRDLARGGSRG